jgi:hypothetical protein
MARPSIWENMLFKADRLWDKLLAKKNTTFLLMSFPFYIWNKIMLRKVALTVRRLYICSKELNLIFRMKMTSWTMQMIDGDLKVWSQGILMEANLTLWLTLVTLSTVLNQSCCKCTVQTMKCNFSRKSAWNTWTSTCLSMACTWFVELPARYSKGRTNSLLKTKQKTTKNKLLSKTTWIKSNLQLRPTPLLENLFLIKE